MTIRVKHEGLCGAGAGSKALKAAEVCGYLCKYNGQSANTRQKYFNCYDNVYTNTCIVLITICMFVYVSTMILMWSY